MRPIQRLLLLSLLLLDNQVEVILPKVTNTIPVVRWSSYSRSASSTSSSSFLSSLSSSFKEEDCAGCAQNKVGLITVTDPILTELRVEYVKQQILKKLRLSKPPEISMPLSTLPKPLINGRVLELRPGAPLEPEKSVDSFYGKTDQIVVFPNEGQSLFNSFHFHIYIYIVFALYIVFTQFSKKQDYIYIYIYLRFVDKSI